MKRTLSTTIRYFWGNDLSGTEQGAGNAPVAKRTRRPIRSFSSPRVIFCVKVYLRQNRLKKNRNTAMQKKFASYEIASQNT